MKYPDVPPVILRLLTSPKLTFAPVKLILPDAVIVPLPNVLLAVALPTVSVVNVPVLVILGCALVVTVPAVTAVTLVKYAPDPVKKLAVTLLPRLALPDVMFPVTANELNVPTEVMFG